MKVLSTIVLSILSFSCARGMDFLEGIEKGLEQAGFEVMSIVLGHKKVEKDKRSETRAARRERYEENGVLHNFDEVLFVELDAKLSQLNQLKVNNSMGLINEPGADGILPLQRMLKAGSFNMAQLALDGCMGTPAAVKLNFAQKNKNPFVKTLLDSLKETQLKFAQTVTDQEHQDIKKFEEFLKMRGAILLNKILQAGASTDYHGTIWGNNQIHDLAKYASEQGLHDLGELIELSREKKYVAMNDLVLMIKDETMRVCQETK